jgi:hypothetical protein
VIVSVDLASRYSAVVGMDAGGEVVFQYDSWNKDINTFITNLGDSAANRLVEFFLIEDLPHGLQFREDVKTACRIQGMVIKELSDRGVIDKVVFCQPKVWQQHYEGVFRGKPKQARAAALNLGYEPPDLHSELHKEARTKARKVETDYIDAFLMGHWALTQIKNGVDLDSIKSTSRYKLGEDQWPIKKPSKASLAT